MAVIRRDQELENIIQIIDEQKIFPTIAELLTSMSYLGFSKKKRLPLKKPSLEIKEETFVNLDLMSDVHLIALAETKDPKIITDNDACIKIFEEYANGGLSILGDEITNNLKRDPSGGETFVTYISKLFADIDKSSSEPINL